MVNCAVNGCTSWHKTGEGISYFKLPSIPKTGCNLTKELATKRRRLWLAAINRKTLNAEKCRVCSKHFIGGKPSYPMEHSHPDWVPSLLMSLAVAENTDKVQQGLHRSAAKEKRYQRCKERSAKARIQAVQSRRRGALNAIDDNVPREDTAAGTAAGDIAAEPRQEQNLNVSGVSVLSEEGVCPNVTEPKVLVREGKKFCEIACQTDLTCVDLNKTLKDLESMKAENADLKKEILESATLSQDQMSKDDKLVKFYTGLPSYVVLMTLFEFVQEGVTASHRNALTKFDEFMLVLIRLRLHVPLQDLAYRFNISQATASRIFSRWITVLSEHLQPAVSWPEREHIRETMPASFQRVFGDKVAVIIDCFEVFIVRPAALVARALTWSAYKHHNTVKFLIGITARGVITFISKAWGGRVSDKHLTENCGFLDNIITGDYVMADRGFNIQDSLDPYNASLVIPAFMRGKTQLSMVETEMSRKIANLRIHVERVIGLVRNKYKILSGTLPIELLTSKPDEDPLIDKISVVCCGLTNLCNSIVPPD